MGGWVGVPPGRVRHVWRQLFKEKRLGGGHGPSSPPLRRKTSLLPTFSLLYTHLYHTFALHTRLHTCLPPACLCFPCLPATAPHIPPPHPTAWHLPCLPGIIYPSSFVQPSFSSSPLSLSLYHACLLHAVYLPHAEAFAACLAASATWGGTHLRIQRLPHLHDTTHFPQTF